MTFVATVVSRLAVVSYPSPRAGSKNLSSVLTFWCCRTSMTITVYTRMGVGSEGQWHNPTWVIYSV